MKTCRRLGISTVAVYSEADRNALHVAEANESYFIGASPARESYLNAGRILQAAQETGADAIHPGYGFLSENEHFADAVEKSGLIFIGPSSSSIRMMGNKLAAKRIAKDAGIPMVPGSDDAISDINEAISIASDIGFPVLIKAAAGGGGKGMRIVNAPEDLTAQVERAMSEASSSFGDGSVFIEKFIASPRHVEIQVLADQQGNCIHLFERECSIQRRHQKIIEEAPSSVLTPEKRTIMGEHAVLLAKGCQYTGAGTVEFLMDDTGNHYFLEMNTRLQVEHPVTEMITGLDLVEYQLRIAEGHQLRHQQDDVPMDGHAVELRVYAERPLHGFSPSTGKLVHYNEPVGSGVRVDSGYRKGLEIPIHYDPMISKLIAHAPTRIEAIRKLVDAIDSYRIEGVETTLEFGKFALLHQAFKSGNFDTRFVERYMEEFSQAQHAYDQVAALFTAWLYDKRRRILMLPKME